MSVAVSQLCNEVCLRPRVVHSPTSATTVHPPTSATVAHSSAYAVARCTFGGEICLSWRRAGVVPLVLKARRVQQASAAACIIINTDDRPLLAHGHTSEDGSEDLGNDIRIPCVVVQHRWAQFMLGECKSTICFDVTKQRQTNVDDVFSASNQPFKKNAPCPKHGTASAAVQLSARSQMVATDHTHGDTAEAAQQFDRERDLLVLHLERALAQSQQMLEEAHTNIQRVQSTAEEHIQLAEERAAHKVREAEAMAKQLEIALGSERRQRKADLEDIAQQSRADLQIASSAMFNVKAHGRKMMEQCIHVATTQLAIAADATRRGAGGHTECRDALTRISAEMVETAKSTEIRLMKEEARTEAAEANIAELIVEAQKASSSSELGTFQMARATEQANLRVTESERRLVELQQRATSETIAAQRKLEQTRESKQKAAAASEQQFKDTVAALNAEVACLKREVSCLEEMQNRFISRCRQKLTKTRLFSMWARVATQVRTSLLLILVLLSM